MSNQLVTFKQKIVSCTSEFEKVATKHLTAERVVKLAHLAAAKNPRLLSCDTVSVIKSIAVFAQLGLEFDTPLGAGYLVPYKTTCTPIIGYRGLIELARRSGNVRQIEARVVYAGDKFDIRYGLDPKLDHVPNVRGKRSVDSIECVYAIATYVDGSHHIDDMSRCEIDAIRARSKASTSGPWVSDYAEMAKKTVVKRLAKYLPLTPELAAGLEVSDAEDVKKSTPEVYAEDGTELLESVIDDSKEDKTKGDQILERSK